MNDEWKMPGTEQEENQQPVGEESEVTEATAVKEPEAGETAEAMPEVTESQEPEVSERVEVTETTEEAATNGDGQVAKNRGRKTEISVGSSAGKRAEERTAGGCDGYSGTATGTAGAAECAQPENSREAASYHWVTRIIRNARTERTAGNVPARIRMRIRITGRMSAGLRIHKITQRQQPNHRITEAGDSRSVEIIQQKRRKQQSFRTDNRGLSEW